MGSAQMFQNRSAPQSRKRCVQDTANTKNQAASMSPNRNVRQFIPSSVTLFQPKSVLRFLSLLLRNNANQSLNRAVTKSQHNNADKNPLRFALMSLQTSASLSQELSRPKPVEASQGSRASL